MLTLASLKTHACRQVVEMKDEYVRDRVTSAVVARRVQTVSANPERGLV